MPQKKKKEVAVKGNSESDTEVDPILAVSLKCGVCKSLLVDAHVFKRCTALWCKDCFVAMLRKSSSPTKKEIYDFLADLPRER